MAKHVSRHQSRDLALKVVFMMSERKWVKLDEAYKYIKNEFYSDLLDQDDFALKIIKNSIKKKAENRDIIAKYAKSFTLDKTNPIDICILENLLTEIQHLDPLTPVPVAINEALVLAWDYWKQWSVSFVNWVIAKFIKDNEKFSKKN